MVRHWLWKTWKDIILKPKISAMYNGELGVKHGLFIESYKNMFATILYEPATLPIFTQYFNFICNIFYLYFIVFELNWCLTQGEHLRVS